MLKDRNEQTLKEILLQVINTPQLKDKYLLMSIKDAWKKCFGPTIQQYTTDIKFRAGALTVTIISAPLRHELTLNKEKIITIMNETLNDNCIKTVNVY